jgi:hypothetical protein
MKLGQTVFQPDTTVRPFIPHGAEQVCLHRRVNRGKLLEAVQNVSDSVGGDAGKIFLVFTDVFAQSVRKCSYIKFIQNKSNLSYKIRQEAV